MIQSKIRNGVTRGQLLTIVVIIVVFVALFVMGMQHVRESARRTDCANRSRELAIASHIYHDSYKRLPAGTLGFAPAVDFYVDWVVSSSEHYWVRAQQTSFMGLVLPFQEMGGLFTLWDPAHQDAYHFLDELGYGWFGTLSGGAIMAFTRMPHTVCPSDNIQDAYIQVAGATQPVLVGGPETDAMGLLYWPDYDYSFNFGRTNYLGCAGAYSGGKHPDTKRQRFVGCMSSREKTTLDSIKDGQSNTIMMGEYVGAISNNVRYRGISWCWGGLARGRGGIAWDTDPASLSRDANGRRYSMIGNHNNSSWVGFGSMHPAGANFAYADCSINLLPRNTDWQILYSLYGASDTVVETDN